MISGEIIEQAAEDGVLLSLSPSGNISAKGNRAAVGHWLPEIRKSKNTIVDLLRLKHRRAEVLSMLSDISGVLREVRSELTQDDIEDFDNGDISRATLTAFAQSLLQHQDMNQGKRPEHYSEQALCKHCGPIWLWFSGQVPSCPWCWNRVAGSPIPRPCAVRCGDCIYFERIHSPFRHPHLGHCAKGESEAIAGLWDTDRRYCERFLPKPQQINDNQSRPVGAEIKSESSQMISVKKSGEKNGRHG